jgi:hypothetical protein
MANDLSNLKGINFSHTFSRDAKANFAPLLLSLLMSKILCGDGQKLAEFLELKNIFPKS